MTTNGEQRILGKLDDIHKFMGMMDARQSSQESQIGVLFKKHETLERNGCSKAETHKDHEDRIRMMEHDKGARPLRAPDTRGVGLGKWLRIQGYSMQEVILLLLVLLIAGMSWKFATRERQLSTLESDVKRIIARVTDEK